MPRRWRSTIVPLSEPLPCVRCGRPALADNTAWPGTWLRTPLSGALCYTDILFLARQATNAHEAVSARDRGIKGRERTEAALAYLSAGHGSHRAPYVGCPFCVRRG